MIDFEQKVDRIHTNDLKWNPEAVSSYLNLPVSRDLLPMWIADTEFACMPEIAEAIRQRADKEIFGYCGVGEAFYQAVCFWQKERFGWEVQPSWIEALPSVVAGINIAIRTFSKKGDGIIIQQPVYDPFAALVKLCDRQVANNGLLCRNGSYEINFAELEQLAARPENTMMILCSPHNPVGRVWKGEELRRIADICINHHVMLVSDEIHGDIVYDGHRHVPILSLGEDCREHFIHLTAPGKTFNIAGLKMSMAIIPNKDLKQAFVQTQTAMSLDIRNTFGIECVTAAYTPKGAAWMKEEVAYLQANVDAAEKFIKESMPGVSMIRPEGTFLCWLDFSGLGLDDSELFRRIIQEAAVICVQGSWFGPGGEGHLRLNIGCQRAMLLTVLERMRSVLCS